MPFHGRPSDACGPCRKGRLRCDRVRPYCSQCMRKSIVCFGYRNVSMLLFKDESESTARKVQWEKNGELYIPAGQKSDGRLAVTEMSGYIWPSPSVSPKPSTEVLAVGYFMQTYISESPFHYLSEIYNAGASVPQDPVTSIILATSLASFSLYVGSSQLMHDARMHYSKALAQTNEALASQNTAKDDNSLISVLALGLYESIAFSSRQSEATWTTHTLGAVQLIRMRGTKQFKTKLGTWLFLQTCNNIRGSCFQREVPLPEGFLDLWEKSKPFLDHSMPVVRLGSFFDKAIDLKLRLNQLSAHKIPTLIHDALILDDEAQTLIGMLPNNWQYHARPLDKTPSWAYQGLAHQYPEHRVARHWNMLRLIRLFLNEVVWHISRFVAKAKQQANPEICLHCKDLDISTLRETTDINRTQIITDLLACVPHFLNDDGSAFVPAARYLILPLSMVVERARMAETATLEPARQFALWCLYEIAKQARTPQAQHAAEAVEAGFPTDWWGLTFFSLWDAYVPTWMKKHALYVTAKNE